MPVQITQRADEQICQLHRRQFVRMGLLDAGNHVLHAELVPEIKQEPNYDAALDSLK